MAISSTGKQQHAKKYLSNYEDKSHACYEPERLVFKWKQQGLPPEEIRANLINFINTERQKCIDDVTYFAETYGLISGPGGSGIIPFKLETYQKELLTSFATDKYVICNKARQLGVSTSLMFYSLWLSIFSTGKRCLVVAHRKESAEEYITKLKTAYEFLPEWLKPACTLYSKSTIEFETKSSVKAITSNPHAARSFSATVFLVDEAAFIKDCHEVIKGLLPTISASDGKLIAISTPNGNSDQNWFYTTFTKAKSGINGWKWFELQWDRSSIFTKNPNFKSDQIRIDNGNVDKFKQEYECFMPGTSILTIEGVKPIEALAVGDMVISHTGRARKITATMNKFFSGNLTSISSYGTGASLISTPEHPIRTYNKENQTYSWIKANELKIGNKVVFPKTQPGTIKLLSHSLCMLLAWYICEGSGSKNQFQFSLSNEEDEKNKVCSYLDILNIPYTVAFTTGWQVIVNDYSLADFFKSSCGNHSTNKKIPFELLSGWETEFFDELMLGDGCFSSSTKEKKYSFHTVSKSLAYQIQLLADSLGRNYAAGITEKEACVGNINGRSVNCSHSYSVQIYIPSDIEAKSNKLNRTKYGVAAYITKIEELSYTGLVYNISVQHDESYIVDGRAVHNCCFDVNLNSLFSKECLQAFQPSSEILNRSFGGITYDDSLFIWKTAEYGQNYTIGVDCASNKSSAKDQTCFQVINKDTIEQHAEYLGKLPTELFVEVLIKTARHYNNALLIIEANTYSEIIFYLLEQKGYTNIWYDTGASVPGFQTNRKTRPLLIEKLLLFFNNTLYMERLRSARLKIQMANFSAGTLYADMSRKFEATRGQNDDAVIAMALALIDLTPREHVHKPLTDFNFISEAKNLNNGGDYSDAYLEYHSQRMGISSNTLASRLKIFHEIKSGVYDGSGLEDMEIEHPVEAFERNKSTQDFIGVPMITQYPTENLDSIDLLPTKRKFTFDDLFNPEFQAMVQNHQNFLYGNKDF